MPDKTVAKTLAQHGNTQTQVRDKSVPTTNFMHSLLKAAVAVIWHHINVYTPSMQCREQRTDSYNWNSVT